MSEWDKKRHFLIRKLNFFPFFSLCAHFSFSLQCYLFFHSFFNPFNFLYFSPTSNENYMSREKFFVWSTSSSSSSFFGNNQRSFSFSTCLNINLIFHYLNWFHLNEISPPPHSLLRGFCVCDFFSFKGRNFSAELWYTFLKFYVSYLAHPTPTSLSLNSLVSFNAVAKLFYVLSIRA